MLNEKELIRELLELLEMPGSPEETSPDDLADSPEMQSLRELERIMPAARAKHIIDMMPGGFFLYHATGNEELIYANQATLLLFGCETLEEFKELTGFTFPGLVYQEDLAEVERSIQEQISESQYDLDYVEYRIVQKDGTVRWVEDYGHFIQTDSGGLFYVFVADATEKRQRLAEERAAALTAVNNELRRQLHIIEGFSIDYESIFYADLDANLVQPYSLSTRTSKLTTLSKESAYDQVMDEYLNMWVVPEDQDLVSGIIDPNYIRVRLSREKAYHTVYRVIENEELVHIEMRIANVSGEGPVSEIVIGFRRVDEEILREMEQRELLENALKRTKVAMEAKNAFLSNMSHDIRTPMNIVAGYTELAKRNLNHPERLAEYLDKIENANGSMIRLIGDVLQIAQLENGSEESGRQAACNLSEVLDHIRKHVAVQAAEKGVRFTLDDSGLTHNSVFVEGEKLQQVLMRLASNAVQFTPGGGTACLTVQEKGASTRDYAHFEFRMEDTGIGIEADFLKKIFEPFERRQTTTESGMPGMGLGLTIARTTVEMMGGTLHVESEVGKGSVFTVALNLRVAESVHVESAPAGEQNTRKRILLVEDNELNRELCAELLTDAGFEIDTAENGLIAVEKVQNSQPGYYSLVLMDIQMPVMDGNAAARAIRTLNDKRLASVPIVALSANALEEDRKRSMESGMNAHMAKPIQIGELVDLLRGFPD